MPDVLIVDPNRVFASTLSKVLLKQFSGAAVDVATNKWELRRRLRSGKYDLAFADLSVSMDGDEMAQDLRVAQVGQLIVWSISDRGAEENGNAPVAKPTSQEELNGLLSSIVVRGRAVERVA